MVNQTFNSRDIIVINESDLDDSIDNNHDYSGTRTYAINLKIDKYNCSFDITVNLEISLFLDDVSNGTIDLSFEKQLFYIVKPVVM